VSVKRALIALGCATVAVAVAAIVATQVRWHGGALRGYGNGSGLTVATGSPFTVLVAQVRPKHRIRIESIRLHHPTPGLVLVGAVVQTGPRPLDGLPAAARRFPPKATDGLWRSAKGVSIPAHSRVALYVGMRAQHDGDFRAAGVDVLYRERRFGIDLRRKEHAGTEVDVCAVRTTASVPDCKIPDFAGLR